MAEILDSGNRREFETGAVRDIQEGKGRCDLLPLDVIADCYESNFDDGTNLPLFYISRFQATNATEALMDALGSFLDLKDCHFTAWSDMFLEVSKHFEEGAKKYGENNWQKGIPTRCYIDSAVRHFFKWLREDEDEPHARAFVWNILCCIWTVKNMPELNDYGQKEGDA